MPKITFTTPKDINNYSPELISKVRNVILLGELAELFDEYDRNEVEEAMFAITADEGTYIDYMSEDEIIDLLWEQ